MIQTSEFKPAWWLPGPHLQTLWPTLFRQNLILKTKRERLFLPDGDFLDLDWVGEGEGPIVIVLHGLGGSIESPYAKGMLKAIVEQGWRGLFLHFRGCSGVPNYLPRGYHMGETSDLHYLVHMLKQRELKTQIAAIGFSLGGSVLLKWLGELGDDNPLVAATAISVPFEISNAAHRFNQGFSRVYQWWLLRNLRISLYRKHKITHLPIDMTQLPLLRSFWEFDDFVTAPLHGFADVHDYYQQASCGQYLHNIRRPTLIINSLDDPFMTHDSEVPTGEIPPDVILELSSHGGHVGFIGGEIPWQPTYWLEERIPKYLKEVLER